MLTQKFDIFPFILAFIITAKIVESLLLIVIVFVIEHDLKLLIQFWEYKEHSTVKKEKKKKKRKKKTRKLTCDIVLLTKVEIFSNFKKFYASAIICFPTLFKVPHSIWFYWAASGACNKFW